MDWLKYVSQFSPSDINNAEIMFKGISRDSSFPEKLLQESIIHSYQKFLLHLYPDLRQQKYRYRFVCGMTFAKILKDNYSEEEPYTVEQINEKYDEILMENLEKYDDLGVINEEYPDMLSENLLAFLENDPDAFFEGFTFQLEIRYLEQQKKLDDREIEQFSPIDVKEEEDYISFEGMKEDYIPNSELTFDPALLDSNCFFPKPSDFSDEEKQLKYKMARKESALIYQYFLKYHFHWFCDEAVGTRKIEQEIVESYRDHLDLTKEVRIICIYMSIQWKKKISYTTDIEDDLQLVKNNFKHYEEEKKEAIKVLKKRSYGQDEGLREKN